MQSPHQSMGYPPDTQPVRPGTSDVLTARTIDATVHPPLTRAQESVSGLVPRFAEAVAPLASPLFLSAVGLTLIFWFVARRMRYRPSALVLSGLLVMTLTSFRPAPDPEQTRVAQVGDAAQVRIPKTVNRGSKAWYRYHGMPGRAAAPAPRSFDEPERIVDEPERFVMEPPTPPDPVEAREMGPHSVSFPIPRIPVARIPEVSAEMVRAAEQMMRDNEQVQRVIRQMRHRIREEARRRRDHRDYGIVLTR